MALLVITIYLSKRQISIKYTVVPMLFMIVMTGWAMILNLEKFYTEQNRLLLVISIIVFILEIWMILEALLFLKKNSLFKKTDMADTKKGIAA